MSELDEARRLHEKNLLRDLSRELYAALQRLTRSAAVSNCNSLSVDHAQGLLSRIATEMPVWERHNGYTEPKEQS